MPAKPEERQYRMMSAPLTAPAMGVDVDDDGNERPQNRFGSECYVEGYATTFEDPYTLFEDRDGWKYVEIIDRHALDGADLSDVIFQYDHEGRVYARNTNNTLYFEPNDHGLFIAADLSKTAKARSMFEDIQVGNVTRMSWAFVPAEEVYTEDLEKKVFTTRITRVSKVYDVSCVSYPADPNTEISARRLVNGEIEARRQRESLQRELDRKRRELALKAKRMAIR
ncbi:MAG: HK97 family phage prohead protease [Atopobiaceae bacterium]|nr:HK97 family phage prohead protease [Atopobiaceae bacterium]